MRVDLKASFFSGHGTAARRYRKGKSVEMPDELRNHLPKSAVVVEEPAGVASAEPEPQEVLKDAPEPAEDPSEDNPMALSELTRAHNVLDKAAAAESAQAKQPQRKRGRNQE